MLIVEDEEILLERLTKTIEWHEIGIEKVIAAQNGEDALKILEKEEIDIILTDIRMPLVDGLCLAEITGKKAKPPKIILMSGFKEFEYAHKAVKLGVKDYILKPFTKEEILEAVKKVVDEIRNYRENEDTLIENCDGDVIKSVFDYLNKHYAQQITLNDVANYVHLHPVYLGRLLRKKVGKTFKEILTEVRLKKAISLLKNSSLKNYEVAEAVGFSDAQYFSQVFKKIYGITPNEWKKLNNSSEILFKF